MKTSLISAEETLRRHDTKVRLAARIVEERFGWRPSAVARMLVLPDASTPRRQVARHTAVLARAYPLRGSTARAWLAQPSGAAALLIFLSRSPRERRGREPVRPRRVRLAGAARIAAQGRSAGVGGSPSGRTRAKHAPEA